MLWLGVPDPGSKGVAAAAAAASGGGHENDRNRDPLREFVVVCRGCWHMSHAGHAEEWFREHDVCAVPGCECRCGEVDAGVGGL